MFISRTRINIRPPFESDISPELVKLYRFFLKKDITKLPITIRKSILEPGMCVVEIPVHLGSICLKPVEELLEKAKREKESLCRKKLIDQKKQRK